MHGCSLTEQDTESSLSPFPQMETSSVLDKVAYLKGELPTWATNILRNVSGRWDGAGGLPHSQRWTQVLKHMELPPRLLQPCPLTLAPRKHSLACPVGVKPGGWGCWFLGHLSALGSSLSCRKVSVS